MHRIAQLVYLMLPAYFANMAPPFVKYWPGWNRPIARRSLGEHKTIMGFAFGVLAAIVTTFVQSHLPWSANLIAYDQWLPMGFVVGVAAMVGDSAKSYFKRRLGIAPGEPWIPMDQLDFVLASLLVLAFWVKFTWTDIVWIALLSFLGDIVINHASYRLGIRDTKW